MSSSPRPGPQLAVEPDGSRAQALVAKYGDACNIPPTPELPR
jgi:hypothetical protein